MPSSPTTAATGAGAAGTSLQAARARMIHLGLCQVQNIAPLDVVTRLGAVQAQEYPSALWAVGTRSGQDAATVEAALVSGDLVRTHVLRPTWHLVAAEDLVWMLRLTAPRVHAATAYYYRQNGFDAPTLERADRTIEEALSAGPLTRHQLRQAVTAAGEDVSGGRFSLALMHAELNGRICSGVPQDGRQTYDLIAARALPHRELTDDEALAELTLRYFTSHGPASLKDFAWWSSLPRGRVEQGLAMNTDRLQRHVLGPVEVWGPADGDPRPGHTPQGSDRPGVHLLPTYDEYTVGYTQTRQMCDVAGRAGDDGAGVLLRPLLVIDGQMAGFWTRITAPGSLTVDVTLTRTLDRTEHEALEREVSHFGRFAGAPATLRLSGP